eukprot:3520709-Amphidinium_carterae.1
MAPAAPKTTMVCVVESGLCSAHAACELAGSGVYAASLGFVDFLQRQPSRAIMHLADCFTTYMV